MRTPNQEITLDAYKGSLIEKGFQSNKLTLDDAENKVKENFSKGLIDQDTFEKALGELDILKGKMSKEEFKEKFAKKGDGKEKKDDEEGEDKEDGKEKKEKKEDKKD